MAMITLNSFRFERWIWSFDVFNKFRNIS